VSVRFLFDGAKRRAFLVGWLLMTAVLVPLSPTLYRVVAMTQAVNEDDSTVIVAAFGPPDDDFVAGGRSEDPLAATRFMVYRPQAVWIALVQRPTGERGFPVWKVVEWGRVNLDGNEAVRRLKGRRRIQKIAGL
jgi:hypothetical protein